MSAAHVHTGDCCSGTEISAEQMRSTALIAAFGEEKAALLEANFIDGLKVEFEAYKFKIEANAKVLKARSTIVSDIPQFWFTALINCTSIVPYLDPVDREALQHLTDVSIDHSTTDPRDFTLTFTFAAKNPYFKETSLVKSFTVQPPTGGLPAPAPYDTTAPLYSKATAITWTSPEHDLVKKAPRPVVEEVENFDEFDGMGSIFGWFMEAGEDKFSIGEEFLEWWPHALEFAAGIAEDDDDSDAGDDFDDDSDDGVHEIDLESEEDRPKKKTKKNKA